MAAEAPPRSSGGHPGDDLAARGPARGSTGGTAGPARRLPSVFRRSALDRVGGYDESFLRAPDGEMNYRLRLPVAWSGSSRDASRTGRGRACGRWRACATTDAGAAVMPARIGRCATWRRRRETAIAASTVLGAAIVRRAAPAARFAVPVGYWPQCWSGAGAGSGLAPAARSPAVRQCPGLGRRLSDQPAAATPGRAGSGHCHPGVVGGIMAVQFRGRIRRWREDKPGGLAVVDVPADLVGELGGRRQMRVTGTLDGAPFTGSTMLVAGGGFAWGSAARLQAACRARDEVGVDRARRSAVASGRRAVRRPPRPAGTQGELRIAMVAFRDPGGESRRDRSGDACGAGGGDSGTARSRGCSSPAT
jgi:hypothetical protein